MRKHPKPDTNHGEIRAGLRAKGYTVQDIHYIGGGCPDILVYSPFSRRWLPMEIKMRGEGLTPDEVKWWAAIGLEPIIVHDTDEAILAIDKPHRVC